MKLKTLLTTSAAFVASFVFGNALATPARAQTGNFQGMVDYATGASGSTAGNSSYFVTLQGVNAVLGFPDRTCSTAYGMSTNPITGGWIWTNDGSKSIPTLNQGPVSVYHFTCKASGNSLVASPISPTHQTVDIPAPTQAESFAVVFLKQEGEYVGISAKVVYGLNYAGATSLMSAFRAIPSGDPSATYYGVIVYPLNDDVVGSPENGLQGVGGSQPAQVIAAPTPQCTIVAAGPVTVATVQTTIDMALGKIANGPINAACSTGTTASPASQTNGNGVQGEFKQQGVVIMFPPREAGPQRGIVLVPVNFFRMQAA